MSLLSALPTAYPVTPYNFNGKYPNTAPVRCCGISTKMQNGRTIYVAERSGLEHYPEIPRFIGNYETEEAAALAHDDVMFKLFGMQLFHWKHDPVSEHSKIFMNYRDKLEFYERLRGCDGVVKTVGDIQKETQSSQYLGVRVTHNGKFQMRICHNKQTISKTYETEMEAALAFDVKARELKGPDVATNFKPA